MKTPAIPGVMVRLKQSTAPMHDTLEALPAMRRLVDPTLTRADYHELLRRFYRANVACEHHLLRRASVWEDQGYDWSSRLVKTAWLEDDLRHLDPAFAPTPFTPDPGFVPYAGEGLARAAGCLYVLEGSTLGSRMIVKLLDQAQQRPAAGASRFFQGYGPATGERWSRLGRELEASLGGDEEALGRAVLAAGETYRFLGRILADP